MYDIIIIGGGMAGMTAALYCLRNEKKVLILEKETVGGQITMSPKVENYPSFKEISGAELADRVFDQVTALGADFELENVVDVTKNEQGFIVTAEYNTYHAKSVVIATGAKPRKLGLDGEDECIGDGVYYCAICDGPFYKGKNVTVIGDANSAMQYALMLAGYCAQVSIITLFDRFFGEKSLEDAIRSTPNIDVTHNSNGLSVEKVEDKINITFENTRDKTQFVHTTDALFIAIGQVPDNKAFENVVDTDEAGYVIADESCVTRTDGVFVAGDCRTKNIRQVATAIGDGATAATAVCKYLNTLNQNANTRT